jgi:hypothetical protein
MSSNTLKGEAKQQQAFVSSFNNDTEQLFCEVPVFCRSIDVVKYNRKTGIITAIEIKRSDWKRAINQALSVSICFDYLEICVLKPKTHRTQERMIDVCKQIGIGLYFYDEQQMTFDKIVEPLKVCDVWKIQKSSVVDYVGGLMK